jgi:hypothetical protein
MEQTVAGPAELLDTQAVQVAEVMLHKPRMERIPLTQCNEQNSTPFFNFYTM